VAWCVDFTHEIYIGADSIIYQLTALTDDHLGTTPATSDPISAAEADELAGLVLYGNQLMRTGPSNLISAAMQVTMWNVEYGSYYAGSDTALAAEVTLLQGIAPSLRSTSGVLLISFTANGQSYASQSLLTDAAPGLTTTAQIPEPSTVTLLGGGLLVLLMVRRKAGRLIGGPRMSRQQG
jgi:PEP-CTERM motif-containing protein